MGEVRIVKVVCTTPALTEQTETLDYIQERSPSGATKVARSVQDAVARIVLWPLAGPQTEDPKLRRMMATPYPYYILYEPTETEIIIHRCRHTSRDPNAP